MSARQQVMRLLWLAAVLCVVTDAEMHHRARRMLLGADSLETLDAMDAFEQYAGCAGPPYCPMDSSYWFCYKGSVRCNLPNCSGCKPCCTDVEEKQPDPPTPIPDDQPIIRPDNPQPVTPAWDDNSSGKTCWDNVGQKSVNDRSMISCAKGGTRMCTNGQWRVTQGECSADEALASDDQGNNQPTVTPVYVQAAASQGKTYVAASAQGSKSGNKKGNGKRRLLAPHFTTAASFAQAQNKSVPLPLPGPIPPDFSAANTDNGKRRLLGPHGTIATTLAQAQSQSPDLPCDATAGCPMDQSYWLCWPGSYRCAMPACKGCSPCCTGDFKPGDDSTKPKTQYPEWDDSQGSYTVGGTARP